MEENHASNHRSAKTKLGRRLPPSTDTSSVDKARYFYERDRKRSNCAVQSQASVQIDPRDTFGEATTSIMCKKDQSNFFTNLNEETPTAIKPSQRMINSSKEPGFHSTSESESEEHLLSIEEYLPEIEGDTYTPENIPGCVPIQGKEKVLKNKRPETRRGDRDHQRSKDLEDIRENLFQNLSRGNEASSVSKPILLKRDDDSSSTEDIIESSPTRTVSTVTMVQRRLAIVHADWKRKTDDANSNRCANGRKDTYANIVEDDLFIEDELPEYARREKLIIPQPIPDRPKVFGGPVYNIPDPKRWAHTYKPVELALTKKVLKPSSPPISTFVNAESSSSDTEFDELFEETARWKAKIKDQNMAPIPMESPPCIKYAFGDPDDCEEYNNKQVAAYKFNKLHKHNLKGAKNPHNIPPELRQSAVEYVEKVSQAQPSSTQAAIIKEMEKKGIEPRVRRVIQEGSYKNTSVDEKKMLRKGQVMLRYSWKGKLVKLTEHLESHKAHSEINLQDECGRTAIHFAASWDCPKTLHILLEIPGANADLQDDEGRTPLHKAVQINSLRCVKALVEFGADAFVVAHDNRNPFEFALQEKGDECIHIIKYLNDDGKMKKKKTEDGTVTHLHQVCLARKGVKVTNVAEELLRSGAFINATEGSGRTPLMLATQRNRPELVDMFLKYKADVTHLDMEHKSALKYATPGEDCHNLISAVLHKKSIKKKKEKKEKAERDQKILQEQRGNVKDNSGNVMNSMRSKTFVASDHMRVSPPGPTCRR